MRPFALVVLALLVSGSAFAEAPVLSCSFAKDASEKRMSGYLVRHVRAGSKTIARLSAFTGGGLDSTRTLPDLVRSWTGAELQGEKAFTGAILASAGVDPRAVKYAKSVAFGRDARADVLVNYLDGNGAMIAGGVVTPNGIIACYPLAADSR